MHTSELLIADIRARFGCVPSFYAPALGAPAMLGLLWRHARVSYLDNPLPAELKERLFVHLSRVRSCSYGVVTHSCELRALGVSGAELLELLQAPLGAIGSRAARVTSGGGALAGWPQPGSQDEARLLALAAHAFAGDDLAPQCVAELRRLLGPDRYARLEALMTYVGDACDWLGSHPEISADDDARVRRHLPALLREEPRLRELLDADRELRVRCARTREHARRLLAQPGSVDDTLQAVLGALGRGMDWSLASIWIPTRRHGTPRLRCAVSWTAPGCGGAFAEANRRLRLDPGAGLPAKAWEAGQPQWIADVASEPDSRCAAAAREDGLRGCYLLPVHGRDGVVALLELLSTHGRPPEQVAIETLDQLAPRIGAYLERRGAQALVLLDAA